MFINISNHPSSKWDNAQIQSAYVVDGTDHIIDIGFPNIPASATSNEVDKLSFHLLNELLLKFSNEGNMSHVTLMVQGEFSFCHFLTKKLLTFGAKVVVACSERQVVEKENGEKISVFKFVQFREIR